MQSILKGGQTTLETACRIANALQIDLSALAGDLYPSESAPVSLPQGIPAEQHNGSPLETPEILQALKALEQMLSACLLEMQKRGTKRE